MLASEKLLYLELSISNKNRNDALRVNCYTTKTISLKEAYAKAKEKKLSISKLGSIPVSRDENIIHAIFVAIALRIITRKSARGHQFLERRMMNVHGIKKHARGHRAT